jgi:hypothetical protein
LRYFFDCHRFVIFQEAFDNFYFSFHNFLLVRLLF